MKIVQKENPILRKKAKEVASKDIGSARIKKIIKDLKEAVSQKPEGVALAAPQIGQSLRIFVVAEDKDFLVFINPRIIKTSRKKETLQEGCLSVRGTYGKVSRAEKLIVEAYDEKGRKFKRGASGLLSEVIQHEIDHLNGVLFTDKATEITKLERKNGE